MKVKLTKGNQVKLQDKPAFIELLKADGWKVEGESEKEEVIEEAPRRGRSPRKAE